MKIYLAGERSATEVGTRVSLAGEKAIGVWAKYVQRRLYSFFYHGFSGHRISAMKNGLSLDIAEDAEKGIDLFLDSGAFTSFTKQKEIPITEYADYVKRTFPIWTVCSSLDAIGRGEEAAQKSYENFRKLRDLGAMVKPVWHVREPDHWLQRYLDEGETHFFIGGMVPETTQWLKERLDGIWSSVLTNKDGTAKAKVHGFGLTTQTLMFRYPWHSVDSTSWLATGIFGACMFRIGNRIQKIVFSESSPEARKFKGWHYNTLPKQSKEMVDSWLEPYSITARQLADHYSYRDVINAAVFQGLEDLGTDRFIASQGTLF